MWPFKHRAASPPARTVLDLSSSESRLPPATPRLEKLQDDSRVLPDSITAPPPPTPESTQTTLHEGTPPSGTTTVNAEPQAPQAVRSPLQAAAAAFGHSAYITFGALLAGLTTDAYANGAHSPHDFLGYYQAHAIGWIVTNTVAPVARAYIANRNAQA